MKKALLLALLLLALTGCAPKEQGPFTAVDYPAAIMAEGTVYLLSLDPIPGEVDESAILGHTTFYTDAYPQQDGETNFNRELGMPYARVEGGIAVLYENEWRLCTPEP